MSQISIERLRENLIEPYDDILDAVLLDLFDHALAFIQTQTGRYFGPISVLTETIRGEGTDALRLGHIPIPDEYGGGVNVLERAYPGADPTLLVEGATDGYEVMTGGREGWLVRWGGAVWTRGYRYTVEYLRGYDEDALPSDIEGLAIGLLSLRLATAGSEGLRSETIGGYSYTRAGTSDLDSLPGAHDTIAAWRREVWAT